MANGILLCRFHHMLIHNQGWTVDPPDRTGGHWKMVPPPGSSGRRPVILVSKSPLRRQR